jgi:ribosomal protein S18 acetylase RimI-like enzyme
MSDLTPIPLTPILIGLDAPEFPIISDWPFPDSYVSRMLRDDIPERVRRGTGRIWIYRDPDGQIVGFGTLDVRDHYGAYTGGKDHPYIPLLAVNPTIASRGYGTSIVRHLIHVANVLAGGPCGIHDVLFLDVYTDNERAIRLYEKCGFQVIESEPIPDPEEGGRPFLIMALRVSGAPG